MVSLEVTEKSSGLRILKTGVVQSFPINKDIEMGITLLSKDGTGKFSFTIIFNFIDDENQKEKRIDKEVDAQNNKVLIKLVNFNNPLGTGTTNPFELCTFDKTHVFLSFWNYRLEKSGNKLEYCFYCEE